MNFVILHSFLCTNNEKQVFYHLPTNDDYSCHWNSAACYQLAQSILKIGSVLAERVGQGEVVGCSALGDGAWRLLSRHWLKTKNTRSGCFSKSFKGHDRPHYTMARRSTTLLYELSFYSNTFKLVTCTKLVQACNMSRNVLGCRPLPEFDKPVCTSTSKCGRIFPAEQSQQLDTPTKGTR